MLANKKKIVIDEEAGLVFHSEEDLYQYFLPEIEKLEKEFFKLRKPTDVPEGDFIQYEQNLTQTLEDPDEVWEDKNAVKDDYVWVYIKKVEQPDGVENLHHVALCYLTNDIPSFVYLHFPTIDDKLLKRYRRGEKVFDRADREVPIGAMDGDALNEGDELAVGLYKAMMLLRSEKDIAEEKFVEFHELREPSIEEPDEIWQNTDPYGNTLVSFIKEHPDYKQAGESVWYIVVTLEDTPSNSHALMFSFPTNDTTLVDRYRHGENLQAEEVVQEASH